MNRKILLAAAILLTCAGVSHARITDRWCVGPSDEVCLDSNLRLQVAGDVVAGASVTASGFFGDGAGVSNYTVAGSSRIAQSQAVEFTSFVQISTVNILLRGSRPVLIFISLIVENRTTGDRTYDSRLTLNGGQIGDTVTTALAKEGGGAGADEVISFHFFASSLPTGVSEFVLEIKSDSTLSSQFVRDVRLTVIEF